MPVAFADQAEEAKLSELEVEVIEMLINFLKLIGLPKSVGEIYGLIFVAPRPLAMDEIMVRLGLSLGAASQGSKLLRSLGAVRVVYELGNRRDHYVADLELSRFATVFIKGKLQPCRRALSSLKNGLNSRGARIGRTSESHPENRQGPARKFAVDQGQQLVRLHAAQRGRIHEGGLSHHAAALLAASKYTQSR